MNKRERGYMELLQERCEVLRTRVAAGESHNLAYVDNWRRELRAMEWALTQVERYHRLRENWIDCDELGLHGRLSVIDAEVDKRLSGCS